MLDRASNRWLSKSNNDSLWGGIDSLNGGKFKDGHDNLQQFNLTWTHRFDESGTFLTSTEAYYIFQTHALVGGTVSNGPAHSWLSTINEKPPTLFISTARQIMAAPQLGQCQSEFSQVTGDVSETAPQES